VQVVGKKDPGPEGPSHRRGFWTRQRANLRYSAYLFRRNPLSVFGLAIVAVFILIAILAPVLVTTDPLEPHSGLTDLPPSATNWMGTDSSGMDIYSRVIYASRVDLMVAGVSVALSLVIGVPVGALSGYFGGVVDDVIMRILDSLQAFPSYILAMAIVAAVGQDLSNIIWVLAFVSFPIYARLIRAQMLSVKESQFAEAARCLGNSPLRIIFRHLLPNCMGPIWVQGSLNAGHALLLAASLSFIGLGVRIPTPEWGLMVSMGSRNVVFGEWWQSFFPGVAIFLAVLGFNLLGDGLQDVFDPKRR